MRACSSSRPGSIHSKARRHLGAMGNRARQLRGAEGARARKWNENEDGHGVRGPLRFLAVHGDAALRLVQARPAFARAVELGQALRSLAPRDPERERERSRHSARAAQGMAEARASGCTHTRRSRRRSTVPDRAQRDTRERKDAEAAVRFLARTDRDVVDEAARALGGEATRAAMELVDRDPLSDLDVKVKLAVREDRVATVREDDERKARARRRDARAPRDPSFDLGRRVATRGSIRFASRSTRLRSANSRGRSCSRGSSRARKGRTSGSRTRSRTSATTRARNVPRRPACAIGSKRTRRRAKADGRHPRHTISSPAALLHLACVADKSRSEEVKKHARETLEQVAAAQGLPTDELADRTVPDLELDANGTATALDFGARKFTVPFDEGLHPRPAGRRTALATATFPRAAEDGRRCPREGTRPRLPRS